MEPSVRDNSRLVVLSVVFNIWKLLQRYLYGIFSNIIFQTKQFNLTVEGVGKKTAQVTHT